MQSTTRARGWFWAGEEPEWIVVATVIVALLLGWILMGAVIGQSSTASMASVTLRYPADWMQEEQDGIWSARELGTGTSVILSVLRELNPANPVSLEELVAQRSFSQVQARQLYRVLASEPARVAGEPGIALTYAYVFDPAQSTRSSGLPVVIQGTDYIVPHGGKVYLLSLEADVRNLEADKGTFARILRSVRFG